METPNLAALRRAIEICGSQRALAAELHISKVAVGQWLLDTDHENHRHVPPKQCVRIEQVTRGRVGRRELRPHDWEEWWPVDVDASDRGIHGADLQTDVGIRPAVFAAAGEAA